MKKNEMDTNCSDNGKYHFEDWTDSQLKDMYESICEEYRRRINDQWQLDIKDSWWVADRVGGVLILCDLEYSLGMEDVKLFVDNYISYQDFLEWWRFDMEAFDKKEHPISAYNWFVNNCRPKDLKDGEANTVV